MYNMPKGKLIMHIDKKQEKGFIKERQYFNKISKLDSSEYSIFCKNVVHYLETIKRYIATVNAKVRDYKNSTDEHFVYEVMKDASLIYITFENKSSYSDQIFIKTMDAVSSEVDWRFNISIDEVQYNDIHMKLLALIKEIDAIIIEFSKDSLNKEEYENNLSTEYPDTKEIYNLYQQFEEKYKEMIKRLHNYRWWRYNDVLGSFDFLKPDQFMKQICDAYMDSKNNLEQEKDKFILFFELLKLSIKDDQRNLQFLEEEFQLFKRKLTTIGTIGYSDFKFYPEPKVKRDFYQEVFEFINDKTKEYFSDDQELMALCKKTSKRKSRKLINQLIEKFYKKFAIEIKDTKCELINIKEKLIEGSSLEIPELNFINANNRSTLVDKTSEEIACLFDKANLLYLLYKGIIVPYSGQKSNKYAYFEKNDKLIRYLCAYDDAFVGYASAFIEIMNSLDELVGLPEFKDYIDYFEFINNKEISEQEVIDETIKKYAMVKENV